MPLLIAPRIARQAVHYAFRYRFPATVTQRTLHVTVSVQAKKRSKGVDVDEFGEGFGEVEEIGNHLWEETSPATAAETSTSPSDKSDIIDDTVGLPDRRKRFSAFKKITPSGKTTSTFRKYYRHITERLSDTLPVHQRQRLSPTYLRKLIAAARVDEDWVRVRTVVDQWQTRMKADQKGMEKALGNYYWILRRMAPAENHEEQEKSEVSVITTESDKDVLVDGGAGIPPDYRDIRNKTEWSMIETSATRMGRHRMMFNGYYDQLMSRLPTKDATLAPLKNVRHMINLSLHRGDLERVAEVLKRWRESMGRPYRKIGEEFIGRCMTLHETLVAINVLTNRADYGIDLQSLKQVHKLFHSIMQNTSLHPEESVEAAFKLAAMSSAMPWRHIMQDPVSSVLLISICHRASRSKYAQTSMEKGAQVLDELGAYIQASKDKLTHKDQKNIYRNLGFAQRPQAMELGSKEMKWRAMSIKAAQTFGKELGLDVGWLSIPEKPAVQPQA
ncbi:hypothetical protein DACRYDRAFT_117945 [Dacryopinax primogenitus]|uniref:Uncharacterized protein n=1 Tax=Dacryopinax primogenitus (strain DJM 731) TaxID=1858805 RepID=M5G5X7_DACPD|nr:uncharacterized protein DACRYDRAFT_117945 [Dacryopinax primogenitus]EJT99162.1 hypothetical protein DACRYDRAFT_117945 [Dacryopinax primogenitus]